MDGRWWCAGRWTAISFGGKPATTTLPISLQRTTLELSLLNCRSILGFSRVIFDARRRSKDELAMRKPSARYDSASEVKINVHRPALDKSEQQYALNPRLNS